MLDVLEPLKIFTDSSMPIIVMETVEEMHAVRLVRTASSAPAWGQVVRGEGA